MENTQSLTPFSNLSPSPFEADINGKLVKFHSAEHYISAYKAYLYTDRTAYKKIIETRDHKILYQETQEIGKKNPDLWKDKRDSVLQEALLRKFLSTEEARQTLLQTENIPLASLQSLEFTQEELLSHLKKTRNSLITQNNSLQWKPQQNIVNDSADVLVNTVNTVGVMGKGVAKAFKDKWPTIMFDYQKSCRSGRLQPGRCEFFMLPDGRFWAGLATKKDWRDGSQKEWIHSGLKDLANLAKEYGIKKIALPPPGCGNGGLKWNDIAPMVLAELKDFNLSIYSEPPTSKSNWGIVTESSQQKSSFKKSSDFSR